MRTSWQNRTESVCGTVTCRLSFFFFNDTATTEIYTLSLHDALPISAGACPRGWVARRARRPPAPRGAVGARDRKSTRLNSSHVRISYAVFCLKKKKATPGTRCREEPHASHRLEHTT